MGERLGAIIEAGSTLPLGGDPRPIGGVGRARFVYAPACGRFETSAQIGNRVEGSAIIARIEGAPLHAPIGGVIRGLTRNGVEVAIRTKVIEVDPRGDPAAAFGLGERPRRIAEGVLKALARAGARIVVTAPATYAGGPALVGWRTTTFALTCALLIGGIGA